MTLTALNSTLYGDGKGRGGLNPRLLNPLTLAFLGDGVFELLVREYVIASHQSLSANRLHQLAVHWVRAAAQSRAYGEIEPLLSEEEIGILKRGRNANVVTAPKNAKTSDYRRATGVEALFGYLYAKGETGRIRELFDRIVTGGEADGDGTVVHAGESSESDEGPVL